MEISVVIPAYNEEKRIKPTLEKIGEYLSKNSKNYEIIVVNDGSKDNTNKVVLSLKNKKIRLINNEKNRGKGYSVKRGVLASKYPLVLFSDSDLATPIEEIEKLKKHLENNEVVIASRNLKESDIRIKQPIHRKLMGKLFSLLVRLVAVRGFKDTQCGFKLFKKEAAQKIFSLQTFERFSFDVEILFIAKKLKYKIKEVPVVWIDQKGSTVDPIKDSIKMLLDLFKIRYNNLRGVYALSKTN